MKPPGHVEFVRLTEKDLAAALALEKACFSMPWSEEQFRGAFAQRNFAVFGLRRRQRLSAYISLYHAASELEILNIAVCPPRRRQGLASRLLRMTLQAAREMDMQRAVLEVRVGNAPATALYEKLGFKREGRRPGYYADTGEDALIYALNL